MYGDIFCFVLSQILVIFGIFGAKYSPFTHETPYIYIHMCFYSIAVFLASYWDLLNTILTIHAFSMALLRFWRGDNSKFGFIFAILAMKLVFYHNNYITKNDGSLIFYNKWWVAISFMQFSWWRYLCFFLYFLPRAITH